MNLLFTGESPEKIINRTKTMTARCWLIRPPREGQHIYAQTGRANSTRFAKLLITKVTKWDGRDPATAGYTNNHIVAKKEGFNSYLEFIAAYRSLNGERLTDPRRTNYFIEFEVIEILNNAQNAL